MTVQVIQITRREAQAELHNIWKHQQHCCLAHDEYGEIKCDYEERRRTLLWLLGEDVD